MSSSSNPHQEAQNAASSSRNTKGSMGPPPPRAPSRAPPRAPTEPILAEPASTELAPIDNPEHHHFYSKFTRQEIVTKLKAHLTTVRQHDREYDRLFELARKEDDELQVMESDSSDEELVQKNKEKSKRVQEAHDTAKAADEKRKPVKRVASALEKALRLAKQGHAGAGKGKEKEVAFDESL